MLDPKDHSEKVEKYIQYSAEDYKPSADKNPDLAEALDAADLGQKFNQFTQGQ